MMTTDTKKTPTSVSANPGKNPKSTLVTIARNALGKELKPEPAAPCRAAIESKAFEIWMARGQEQGHDQEHWYEAERQLQQN
jgi:hypothetical protein